MRAMKFRLVGIGLICFLIWLPNMALGHVRFHACFGHPVFYDCFSPYCVVYPYHYPFRCWGGYPHGLWVRYYWGGPFFFERDYYPVVIDPPFVVEVPKVIVERRMVVKPQYDDKTAKLFEQLRHKKGELLKRLETGDKEECKRAIDELAGFSFDEKVRGALEHILASDPDPELRKKVAESLAKVKNTDVLPALEKARVEDADKEVREEADKAIKKIRGS